MDKIKSVTISSPNPYNSKENKTPMVSYKVTGSKEDVASFKADQLAEIGRVSEDEQGNPLFHVRASNAGKYGVTSTLQRATSPEGEVYWFADNAEQKQLDSLIVGADSTTKEVYAEQKIAEMREFARVLASNRAKNIAALQAKTVKADLTK